MDQIPSSEAVTQQIKKYLAFYGTRLFITVFTTARLWSYLEPDECSPNISTLLS
jgi:hypothetical protein